MLLTKLRFQMKFNGTARACPYGIEKDGIYQFAKVDGIPVIHDYEIKHILKEASSYYVQKKIIDGFVFMKSRTFPIKGDIQIGQVTLTYPRGTSMRDGFVGYIKTAEAFPDGCSIDFEVLAIDDGFVRYFSKFKKRPYHGTFFSAKYELKLLGIDEEDVDTNAESESPKEKTVEELMEELESLREENRLLKEQLAKK